MGRKDKADEQPASELVDQSEIIEMALSDKVTFADIYHQYGLREDEVKEVMRRSLKSGSYRAWRKRVGRFRSTRASYK